MAAISPVPKLQFFAANGTPLVGGKLYAYAAGTTTPLATYTDAGGGTANPNPVVLDSRGEASVWLGTDLYKLRLTTATDVDVWTVDNVGGNATLAQLAASSGAGLIGFLQSGTGAVARTVQTKLRDVVNVKDFGAYGNGGDDDTLAIQAAITYAKTLIAPKLIIDRGTYLVSSTLTFDLPNNSTIEFIGTIKTATGNPAIRIGSTSTNRNSYTVTGVKVERTTNDTSNGSAGVQIRNLVSSYIDIRKVTGFQDGILCYADQGNGGVSYNQIQLGLIHDNRYNLHLQAAGAGYVNENVFIGGTYNHSSGYPAVSTTNIWIDYGTYRNNNNRFICPSLEDNSTLAVAAVINGDNNLILHPRMERSVSQSTYEIQFTANSSENQIIGAGFTMVPTNINDAGGGNCYETRQNVIVQKQTGANKGLLTLRSTASSSARVVEILDSGGVARGWILGDGTYFSSTNGYFENGIRFSTASGTRTDRGLFVGSGSPEGVVTADTGSLYCNTAGGAGTTLYVKQSGSGNTGWVGK